jgi:hypothetical protein
MSKRGAMVILSVGQEVSRFLQYYFDSNKKKESASKKYCKIHFNLDSGRAEVIFD